MVYLEMGQLFAAIVWCFGSVHGLYGACLIVRVIGIFEFYYLLCCCFVRFMSII